MLCPAMFGAMDRKPRASGRWLPKQSSGEAQRRDLGTTPRQKLQQACGRTWPPLTFYWTKFTSRQCLQCNNSYSRCPERGFAIIHFTKTPTSSYTQLQQIEWDALDISAVRNLWTLSGWLDGFLLRQQIGRDDDTPHRWTVRGCSMWSPCVACGALGPRGLISSRA